MARGRGETATRSAVSPLHRSLTSSILHARHLDHVIRLPQHRRIPLHLLPVRARVARHRDVDVRLAFATKRVVADTTRMEIANGSDVAIVGHLRHFDTSAAKMTIEPLVMGGPSLEPASPELSAAQAMWACRSP